MLPTCSPAAIKALREAHRLHQVQVAALLYVSRRTVQYWEEGARDMPLGLWELFNVRVGEMAPIPAQDLLQAVPVPRPKKPSP